jgi:hypothetical protein
LYTFPLLLCRAKSSRFPYVKKQEAQSKDNFFMDFMFDLPAAILIKPTLMPKIG